MTRKDWGSIEEGYNGETFRYDIWCHGLTEDMAIDGDDWRPRVHVANPT